MNYQFVLLDVDGTILDFNACEAQAFKRAFEQFGYHWTEEIYHRYHGINAMVWEIHERGEKTREEILVLRFELLFNEYGIDGDPAAFEDQYRRNLADYAFFEPGAEAFLQKLKDSSAQSYIVTNGVLETQVKRLEMSGINRYVDGVFISEAIGWQKPKREYFDHCFANIPGFCKEKAIIVGDSLSADIQGGINADIATCWYNPAGKPDRGMKIDYEVKTLDEVWKLLSE
ncbi:MAG: YjjG family noncanonical pyrimidine nucleotidase [Lachnospiraceae bacterium]|nr:YjjG family noncanonical pyrimidine nucleotidase [Lachnospiraceae bacterium]